MAQLTQTVGHWLDLTGLFFVMGKGFPLGHPVQSQDPTHLISCSMGVGAPIILCLCPSLSAHENESMLRTYLVCREKRERERDKQANGTWEMHTVYWQQRSCYLNVWVVTEAKQCHCACSPILGSPNCVWPLRNREPPAKICRLFPVVDQASSEVAYRHVVLRGASPPPPPLYFQVQLTLCACDFPPYCLMILVSLYSN
jgi:hypothetical protein